MMTPLTMAATSAFLWISCPQHLAAVPPMLRLDRARTLAQQRIHEMDALLKQFDADSFGCF